MQAVLAGEDEPDAGSVADSTLTVVLDDALREAREDLAELDGLGEELSRVPEDAPGASSARPGTTARSAPLRRAARSAGAGRAAHAGGRRRCSSTSRPGTCPPPCASNSEAVLGPGTGEERGEG